MQSVYSLANSLFGTVHAVDDIPDKLVLSKLNPSKSTSLKILPPFKGIQDRFHKNRLQLVQLESKPQSQTIRSKIDNIKADMEKQRMEFELENFKVKEKAMLDLIRKLETRPFGTDAERLQAERNTRMLTLQAVNLEREVEGLKVKVRLGERELAKKERELKELKEQKEQREQKEQEEQKDETTATARDALPVFHELATTIGVKRKSPIWISDKTHA